MMRQGLVFVYNRKSSIQNPKSGGQELLWTLKKIRDFGVLYFGMKLLFHGQKKNPLIYLTEFELVFSSVQQFH